MIPQLEQKTYTITEYLEFEDQAKIRHEYINGDIIAMTGGTTNHNLIAGNILSSFKTSPQR